MFHNCVVYGIISTVNSFAFLHRETGGKLYLTQLIPATQKDPTILGILYYFSNLCASAPLLVETNQDGRPVTVVRAAGDSSNAPLVPTPSAPPTPSTLPPIQLNTPRRSPRFQQDIARVSSKSNDLLYLDIDVRTSGTHLGCKGYKAILHTGETVFAKLWDGWKHSSEEADQESKVYHFLRGLWGTVIPRFITYGGWGFCHIVILEFIKVILLKPEAYS
jgi:serine/threonine protein kinase